MQIMRGYEETLRGILKAFLHILRCILEELKHSKNYFQKTQKTTSRKKEKIK